MIPSVQTESYFNKRLKNRSNIMSLFRRAGSTSIILIVCSTILLIIANHAVAHASDDDARERGANLFHTRGCERCHSITGVGGDRAPELSSVALRRTPRQIKTQIMNGGHGMPPFASVLTKDEVKDLVTFLSSCRTDTAPGCRTWTAETQPAQ